jgi:uncharacterized protein
VSKYRAKTHKSDSSSGLVDESVLEQTAHFVKGELSGEPTGHDWWHARRVRALACEIASREGADCYIVQLAALLHDIGDFKFTGDEEIGAKMAAEWLSSVGVEVAVVSAVKDIIRGLSFVGAGVPEVDLSLEGMCVQDADRLDALGAIGIARTFAYGGYARRPIHDPGVPPVIHDTAESYRTSVGTTINHFHEKLLLLRDRMRTRTGQEMAVARHEYMVDFLQQFEMDWNVTAPT